MTQSSSRFILEESMDKAQFSFKDLESVVIKPTLNIEMNGRTIKAHETIAAFDKIQLANFEDMVQVVTAHGGYEDADRVWWETTKSVHLTFTQGIFSAQQFALMNNSRLLEVTKETPIYLDYTEVKESDENGVIEFTDSPYDYFFVYKNETGERIDDFVRDTEKISNLTPYTEYTLNYVKQYQSDASIITIGAKLSSGFFTLQGKTRVKDDITGIVRTGIITIPKLKLMTGISMRLGRNANPIVGKLEAEALPVGPKGNTRCLEIAFLGDYIDSDW